MRWTMLKRRVGVLLSVTGVLAGLSACSPRSDVSKADVIAPPVAPPASADNAPIAGAGAVAPGPKTSASAHPAVPKEPTRQPSSIRNTAASQPLTTQNAPVQKAAPPSRTITQGDGAWPQFRGPDRTGVSKETGLLKQWPESGPLLLWKASGLGTGNSAPSVAGGRIFGMSYRGSDECVWALDEKSGKPGWNVRIAAANYEIGPQAQDGPGCTPTVVGDRLYALGASGDVVCLQVSDGKLFWQKNLVKDFGGTVPRWGYAESPLVDGNKVIVTPGGTDSALVALDRMTGAVIWKGKVPQGDGAAYASAITGKVGGNNRSFNSWRMGSSGWRRRTGASSGATMRQPTTLASTAAPRSFRRIRSLLPLATIPAAGWRSWQPRQMAASPPPRSTLPATCATITEVWCW